MYTQKQFIEGCLAYYKEWDLTPGNPDDGTWETAHYPLPRGMGDGAVKILHEHHQIQGLLQSKDVGRMCFFPANVKDFLNNNFCDGWFDLYEMYEQWLSINGQISAARKVGIHAMTEQERFEPRSKGGRALSAISYISTANGFVSSASGVCAHNIRLGAPRNQRAKVPGCIADQLIRVGSMSSMNQQQEEEAKRINTQNLSIYNAR